MSEVKLAVDVGGSLTKCVYSYKLNQNDDYGKKEYLLFDPNVEVVSSQRFEQYYQLKGSLGIPKPEDNAWLVINDRHVVIGSLAKEFDFEDRLRDVKYELAIYKVLAAIGMIVKKHTLKANSLQVTLGVLLPWNEYNDRSLLAERLRNLASTYRFQKDLNLSLKFNQIEIRPEGFGLFQAFYRTALQTKQKTLVSDEKQGILMLGHRNVTGLYFERGRLTTGDSPLLGFSNLCDRVVELSSRSNREEVTLAISKTISQAKNFYTFAPYEIKESYSLSRWRLKKVYPQWEKMPLIMALSSAKESELKEAEVKRIGDAIRQATEEYWEKLERWLKKIFPQDLDGVVVSGGAQLFLEPKLEKYFNCLEIFFSSSTKPNPEYVNENKARIELENLTDGKRINIHNKRTLVYRYDELAETFKISKKSHLMYRLLDVYELHWKL